MTWIPESVIERIVNKVIDRFISLHFVYKGLTLLIVFVVALFFARIGGFGEPLKNVAKLFYPKIISHVDTEKPTYSNTVKAFDGKENNPKPIFLDTLEKPSDADPSKPLPVDKETVKLKLQASLVYVDNGYYKRVINGDSYKSGDELYIEYSINLPSWALVIGVCDDGVQPLLSKKYIPVRYHPNDDDNNKIRFVLDDAVGQEQYYVFASKNKFSFEKDIFPFLQVNEQHVFSKGSVIINKVGFPKGIICKHFWITHL